MSRESVSIDQIGDILGNTEDRTHQLRLRTKHGEYKVKRLHSDLAVPSYIHGYSLAIEYMRSWFLERFERMGLGKDYFKTVYINGKHVLDDYKYLNKNVVKRENPVLAIVPTVEFDYDREGLDIYLADPSIFLRRSNYQQSFFRDMERDQYLGVQFQEIKMGFAFRIRVNTRAQQLDLMKKMELAFRLGSTQREYFSADFHIPKDVMLSIAEAAGFEVNRETQTIKDTMQFVAYLNANSDLPILYKLRAINQKPEFFIRVRDMYAHIACRDKISPDDGERTNQLDNNYNLDFATELRMPVPHFYVYYSQDNLDSGITIHENDKGSIGLYSFNDFEIPEKNTLGWSQIALTSYLCDKGEKFVDMKEVFSGNTNLDIVMEYNLKQFISPLAFMDIQVFRNDDRACKVKVRMDFEEKKLYFLEDMDEETVYIAIYADRKYVNETMTSLAEFGKTRIEVQK